THARFLAAPHFAAMDRGRPGPTVRACAQWPRVIVARSRDGRGTQAVLEKARARRFLARGRLFATWPGAKTLLPIGGDSDAPAGRKLPATLVRAGQKPVAAVAAFPARQPAGGLRRSRRPRTLTMWLERSRCAVFGPKRLVGGALTVAKGLEFNHGFGAGRG